jgi:hypothetical protein
MVKKEKKNNLRFKKIIDCLILRLNENRDKMNRERERVVLPFSASLGRLSSFAVGSSSVKDKRFRFCINKSYE